MQIFRTHSVHTQPTKKRGSRKRIGMEWNAFDNTWWVYHEHHPTTHVYNQCVLPALTYSAETWHLMKELERNLRSAQRGMRKKLLGAAWIREQTEVEDIVENVRWTCGGHIMCRVDNRWTNRA